MLNTALKQPLALVGATPARGGGWVGVPGLGSYFWRGKTIWIQYFSRVAGRKKPHRESTGSSNVKDAIRLLKQKSIEMAAGKAVGPALQRTTFFDLKGVVTANYTTKGRRSVKRMKIALNHLDEYFGADLARDITNIRLVAYQQHRQQEKAANSAINYELAILRRAFNLAFRNKLVAEVPYFEKLPENNVRKGFFEDAEFAAVLSELRDYLKPLAECYFTTGWRREELLSRKKHHVDLDAGWLRLDPGETKNGKGRNFPLTPHLHEVLSAQLAKTRALEEATGQIIPWLFQHNGRRIKDFRTAWEGACTRAGVSGRLVHDFRRTACRNLERAGVSRSDAMAMVGHLTESVYRRYAISDERSMKESAMKIAALDELRAGVKAARKVVSLETAKNVAAQ